MRLDITRKSDLAVRALSALGTSGHCAVHEAWMVARQQLYRRLDATPISRSILRTRR